MLHICARMSIRRRVERQAESGIYWNNILTGFRNVSILISVFTVLLTHRVGAQQDLSWDILSDVSFEEKYLEDSDTYWLIPTFGDYIKLYEEQEVTIEGYLIVIDIEENFYVLSKYPYSACFFCGAAGPDSIVELQLNAKLKGVQMDQKVLVKGRLELNEMDIEHFNYLLSEAEIVN